MLSLSNLATDPRVNRQLQLLLKDYQVTAAGLADAHLPGLEFILLPSPKKTWGDRLVNALLLKLNRFQVYYWSIPSIRSAFAALRHRSFDLIIANDAGTWPLAFALRTAGGGRVLCDAHEYAPLEFADRFHWRFLYQRYTGWVCRTCLPQADGLMTVGDGIAAEYARAFSVTRPVIVRNTPAAEPGSPRPTPPEQIRLIHHGLASRSRHIETMIDLMAHLDDRFTLDLMLVSAEPGYLQALQQRAAGNPRIRFRDPVSPVAIIRETRDYDLGLFLLPPANFNYRFALPNKFFEFIQARLAVAIGPSPEMARLVREYDCGVVAADFTPQALAAVLQPLTAAQIDAWKRNSHRAAGLLCWDREQETLVGEVRRLLALPPCAV